MKQNMIVAFAASACLSLASCSIFSSPESQGEAAGDKIVRCEVDYCKALEEGYEEFCSHFDAARYDTREDALQELDDMRAAALERRDKAQFQAQEYSSEQAKKYKGEDLAKYEGACLERVTKGLSEIEAARQSANQAEARAKTLVRSIIPKIPGSEKVAADLVGRTFCGIPGHYFNENFRWRIDGGEVRDLSIADIQRPSATSAVIDADALIESPRGGQYKLKAKIHYRLDDTDGWVIDMLQPESFDVVRTGRYDDAIRHRREGVNEYEMEVRLRNLNDNSLRVGMRVKYRGDDGWRKCVVDVPGNGEQSIGGLFLGSVSDYVVDFVELP